VRISLLKGKLHRCTVTHADLTYEGSITISEELAEAAGLLEYEQVHVWNVTTGGRFVTYVMIGSRDSRVICVNGAAARLVARGDKLIVAAFADFAPEEAAGWRPHLVFVDDDNRIKALRDEVAGPQVAQVIEEAAIV
jgi:aspartate 1-decarboxylase